VAEVLALLGGSFYSEQFCTRHSGLERACAHAGDCSVRLLWRTVQQALDGILEKTTLNDLLKPEPEMTDFLKSLVTQPQHESEAVVAHVNGY
jgi:DNA-binding IscR family transcriptional regulator